MLINLQEMLQYAAEKKIAVGSFNVYNVESLQAVVHTAQHLQSPVIISFGEAYDRHMPLEAMAELVKFYTAGADVPMVLHLDHSKETKVIFRALRAGFTSVMFDGSKAPLEENIRMTCQIADIAHALDVSVEGELGYMNPEDGSDSSGQPEEKSYTTVAAAKAYAASSGADALAIAIGNAHGIYQGTPRLDFVRLAEIRQAVEIPLVLHGSSGIPAELLQKAIRLGIRKININTEVSTAGIAAAREFLAVHKDKNTRFETIAKAAEEAMMTVIQEDIQCFSLVK